jgi:hypothetical protein
MKSKIRNEMTDDLRPEYDLRQLLKGGVRGKYAKRRVGETNMVLLSPDVHRAFPNEKAVNDALRLVLQLTRIPNPKGTRTEKDRSRRLVVPK